MVWFIDNAVTLVDNFATAASTDPISAVLLAAGAVFVTASAGGFGVLALGALVDALVPESATQHQQPQR